jgi:hypothetical protein
MQDNILKIPGTNEEISIHCPSCNSMDVTIDVDSHGYYEVISCYDCGYKRRINY